MQGKHLYEYAVVRVMPRVERGEFLNVGVVLYCSGKRFLKVRFDNSLTRLQVFPQLDVALVAGYLASFERICGGGASGGTIGSLPLAERFRWLTATRSTIIQASQVHPGFCDDPDVTLNKLFDELVLTEGQ